MKDKKKIAFVLGGMSFGGAERVISILANHYAQKGWQADILTLLKPDCDFELHPSIRHIHMGGSASSRALRRSGTRRLKTRRVERRFLSSVGFDFRDALRNLDLSFRSRFFVF